MPNYTNRYKTNEAADRQAAGLQLRRVELAEQAAADREQLSWQDLEFRKAKEAYDQSVKSADMFQEIQGKKQATMALGALASIRPEDPDAMMLAAAALRRLPLAAGDEAVNKHYSLIASAHQAANDADTKLAVESGVDGRSPDFQITDPKTGRWVGRDWNKYGQAVTAAKLQRSTQTADALLKQGGGTGKVTIKQGDVTVDTAATSPTDLALEYPTALTPQQQALGINSGNSTVMKQDIAAGLSQQAQAKAAAAKEATGVKRTAAAADLMTAVASYKTKMGVGDDDPVVAKLLSAANAMTEQPAAVEDPATPAKKLSPSAQKAIDELNRLNPPTK